MREHKWGRGRERGIIWSGLYSDSSYPNVGLELMNHKIMIWGEVRCSTDWVTQVPWACNSWSQGCKFEPHTECRPYLKIKSLKKSAIKKSSSIFSANDTWKIRYPYAKKWTSTHTLHFNKKKKLMDHTAKCSIIRLLEKQNSYVT